MFWINADTTESLRSGFMNIVTLLCLPLPTESIDVGVTINSLKEWLTYHEHWLLIFDNADNLDLLDDYRLLLHINTGHILITTHATATGGLTARTTSIETMWKEEAALLLLRRAKVLTPEASLEQVSKKMREDAEAIVTILDGLPLALDQAGAYLEETGSSLASYVSLYQQKQSELLNERGRFAPGHPQPVATTWSLSFHIIEQTNPAAAELLRLCAFLQPDVIPIDMLTIGCSYLSPVLEPVARDPFTLDRTIGELLKFSLVKRSLDREYLQMHRLVQAVLRDTLDIQIQKAWIERVIKIMNIVCSQLGPIMKTQYHPYLLQAKNLSLLVNEYKLPSAEASSVFLQAAYWLSQYFYYSEAESLYTQTLNIRERTLGSEHPATVDSLHRLALLYRSQGKFTKAQSLLEQVLRVSERVGGPEHPDTIASLNNLALIYQAQRKYAKALLFFVRALRVNEQVLGPKHPLTISILNNLALFYQVQGKHADAQPLFEHVLHIREQVLGLKHLDTAASLNNLALFYRDQGKYAKAEPLFERALQIYEQELEYDHPANIKILNNLARCYQSHGKYEKAEFLFKRALQIYNQTPGAYHHDVAGGLHNLALLYRDQGKYEEAESLFKQIWQLREQVIGTKHPATRAAKENYLLVKHRLFDKEQFTDKRL